MGGACATSRPISHQGFLEGVVQEVARDGKSVRILSTAGKFTITRETDLSSAVVRGDPVYCLVEPERTLITPVSCVRQAVQGQVYRPAAAAYYLFKHINGATLVLPLSALSTSFEVTGKPVDCILQKHNGQLEFKIEKYNPFSHFIIEEAESRLLSRYRTDFKHTKKVNIQQIQQLKAHYAAFRRVRKDGNAFFRCIFVQFLEHFARKTTQISELEQFLTKVDSKSSYFAMLPDYQVYSDRVSSVLHKLRTVKMQNRGEELAVLQWMLQDMSVDLALVHYIRLLVANFTALHYRSARLKRFFITDVKEVVKRILAFGQEAESIVKYVIPNLLKVVLVQQDIATDCDEVFETLYAPEEAGHYPVLHVCKSSAQAYHILYSETQHAVDGYDLATHTYDLTAPSEALKKEAETLYLDICPSSLHAIQT